MLLVTLMFVLGLSSFGASSPVQLEEENYNSTNLRLPFNRNTDDGPTLFTNVTDLNKLSFNRNSTNLAKSRSKRSRSLVNMIQCGAPKHCGRKYLFWYGNYCGIGGSGTPIDGIDRCCQKHDACYNDCYDCWWWEYYLAAFNWQCRSWGPHCSYYQYDLCRHQLCQCDSEFVECLNSVARREGRWLCSRFDAFLELSYIFSND